MGEYHLAETMLTASPGLNSEELVQLCLCRAYTTDTLDYFFESISKLNSNPEVAFEIHFLTGNYNECSQLLDNVESGYLKFRYYLAIHEYDKASESLKHLPKDGFWYYSMGRLYGHQSKYHLSFEAHKQAILYFEEKNNNLMIHICKANLGNYKNLNNDILEAEKLFFDVEQFIDENISLSGFFEARLRMNLGHFLLERAQFNKAKKNLEKAYNLLSKRPSNELTRASLLLANYYIEEGNYKEVASLLENIQIFKSYQKLDALRYSALAYSRLGQHSIALHKIEKAMDLIPEALEAHKYYCPIDYIEVLYNSGDTAQATKLINKHLGLCRETNDLAFWYCLNRWNYLTNSELYNLESTKYHDSNNLGIEKIRDYLIRFRTLIKTKAPSIQIEVLKTELQKMELPQIYKDRFELYKLLSQNTGEKLCSEILEEANTMDLRNLLLCLIASLKHYGFISFKEHEQLWQKAQKDLSWGELIYKLQGTSKSIGLCLHLPETNLPKAELRLNTELGEVIYNNEVLFTKNKKQTLWNLLYYILNESQEIEKVARDVFSIKDFNPEIHNNNISVNLNRINKLLPPAFKLKQADGKILIPQQLFLVS